VAFCEIERFACKVLEKNFPDIPIHRDIRELNGSVFTGIDLITGGYPCQPFSTAGKRLGTKDNRHLWPEMRRVITQAKPTWVLCENVVGHVSMGLDDVLSDMEGKGYTGQPLIIPACAKNAPHERNRVWIIFHANSPNAFGIDRSNGSNIHVEEWAFEKNQQKRLNRFVKLVPRAAIPRATTYAKSLRKLDGIPNWMDRNRTLGNAIVPQVAYEILRAIKTTQHYYQGCITPD